MSFDLLGNAIVSGLLLGGFYAAVTIGVSISFGMLDIVNIAHPAFIILGSYIAYIANAMLGIDPILASVIALPAFYLLGAAVYQIYYVAFERRGDEALRGLAFFFGLLFITEVTLVLVFGVDYRLVDAPYIGTSLHLGIVDLPLRLLVPCLVALVMVGALQLFMSRSFLGRAILAVAQDQLALRLMAANPTRIKRIAFGLSIATASVAGAVLIIIQPVEPSIGRDYIGRVFAICVLGGMGSFAGTVVAAMTLGIVESLTVHILWAVLVAGGRLWISAGHARRAAGRAVRPLAVNAAKFLLWLLIAAGAVFGLARLIDNAYVFFAGYVVLQYIVLATAWNILGGYTGYVNFGTAAFFALGAYTTVVLHKLTALPLPLMMPLGGVVSGIVGLGTGYLTLRLRGAFFSIATLALAVVVQTLITNWNFVGGSRGAYIVRPAKTPLFGIDYIEYLFLIMLALVVIVLVTARAIERSRLGYGFATIRDDEVAAEASGVPTLRLKLLATTLSGAFMGMAGAPLPYYVTYLDPASGFNLAYAVNGVAMPLVGGTSSWLGPVIGAILLGTLQQVATVTISSALNLLIVGLMLVGFVIVAPNGILGLLRLRGARVMATAPR